ncbi:MAG TPA: thioredoxin family protein [Chitinophagales bacterium]
MALTPSNMISLGTIASDFSLPDTISNETKSLANLKGEKATVILFICNHCPYVKHLNNAIVNVANNYLPKGVSFVAISSNDAIAVPEDSPEKMKENALKFDFKFPYLYDETQAVAKAYDAACTPDIYVYDKDLKLVYRGQFDDSRPSNQVLPTGKDLANALDAILSGNEVSKLQKPSIGCNIKWK